jgi:hypothetical protein
MGSPPHGLKDPAIVYSLWSRVWLMATGSSFGSRGEVGRSASRRESLNRQSPDLFPDPAISAVRFRLDSVMTAIPADLIGP